jgi:hemolysin activation/secretion protein
MGEGLPMRPTSIRPGGALGAGLAACLLVSAVPARAQSPPTREQVVPQQPERTEPPAARLTIEGGVERAPCALDRPDLQSIRFTLADVEFADLRGLAPDALRPAFAPYLGRDIPLATICEIRDRAATILRDAGYIAAVEVPEQRIEGGHIRFQVLMAKLVGLRVRGEAGRSERTIATYLGRLTDREVFNRFEAERYLLLAGDLPGYDVRLALRSAGAARGEVIGEVTVVRQGASAELTVQNLGSRELGRWGALLRGQVYGLTDHVRALQHRRCLRAADAPDRP